jgi:hypothetical protein
VPMQAVKSVATGLAGGAVVLAWILGVFSFLALPYLIADPWRALAQNLAGYGIWISIFVAILAALVGLVRPARGVAAIVLLLCSFAMWAAIWIWSVLIVSADWGIVALYVVNFFIGIGTILSALLALLLRGQWSLLGFMLVFCVVAIAAGGLANYWGEQS